MGICNSCEATNVATAKIILYDGRLQEYSYPVKVSYVLQKNPAFFICNSDEMDFDDVVSAISDDEVLQPGQLYFALPLNRLRQRLQAEEMASLAVKASSALTRSGGEKCGCRRKSSLFFPGEIGGDSRPSARIISVGEVEGRGNGRSGGGGGGGRGRRRKNSERLSTIQE